MNEDFAKNFLTDYSCTEITDCDDLIENDNLNYIDDIKYNVENMNFVHSSSDAKRTKALKDYLEFEAQSQQKGGAEPTLNIDNYLVFKHIQKRLIHKFRYEGFLIEIGFKNLPANIKVLDEITYQCFEKILAVCFKDSKTNDKVRIVIEHPGIPNQPISMPYMRHDEMNVQLILTAIALVAQSHKDLKLDEFMRITTSRIEMPVGGKNIEDYISDLRSCIKINNSDNLCLLRAVVVACAAYEWKHEIDKDRKKKLEIIYVQLRRPGNNNIQTAAANQLQMQLNLGNGPYELDVIPIIETYKDIQITVIGDVSYNFKCIYKGQPNTKHIFLF